MGNSTQKVKSRQTAKSVYRVEKLLDFLKHKKTNILSQIVF